jgi:hypothetical protein
MGQLRPGVQFKATPKGMQQLFTQREFRANVHNPRTDKGCLQQGPCGEMGIKQAIWSPHTIQTAHSPCNFPAQDGTHVVGQKPSSSAGLILKSQKGIQVP